jgi:hypothetical protein
VATTASTGSHYTTRARLPFLPRVCSLVVFEHVVVSPFVLFVIFVPFVLLKL